MIRGELRVALAGILALVTLVAFEAMAVSTAMPVVASDLGGLRSYGLAFSLFLTTSLLGMVLAGGWNDVRGPLPPVVAGLVSFAGGQLVCGLAPTFGTFLAGRAVAGLGGGMIVVTLYVVVGLVFPEPSRPRVFAWISSAWVVPALVGPLLAGWLAAHLSWRAVFLLVPPLAVAALAVLGPRLAAVSRRDRSGDPPAPQARAALERPGRRALSGLLLAGGAALAQGGAADLVPLRPLPVAATLAGLVLVAVALPQLVPPGTLRAARGLPSVVAVRGLFTACFTGAEAYIPLMLVVERGMSVTLAGLSLTGAALGWTLGSSLQGRPHLVLSRHHLMALSGGLVALSVGLLVLPSLALVPGPVVWGLWALGGLGMGMALASTGVLVLSLSPPEQRGRNSSALQLSDALGSVLGIAAAGAVLAARTGGHAPSTAVAGPVAGSGLPAGLGATFAVIFGGLAVVGVLAAVVAARVGPAPAPSALDPRAGEVRGSSAADGPAPRPTSAEQGSPDTGLG